MQWGFVFARGSPSEDLEAGASASLGNLLAKHISRQGDMKE
jgi:hypothetical protein